MIPHNSYALWAQVTGDSSQRLQGSTRSHCSGEFVKDQGRVGVELDHQGIVYDPRRPEGVE